MTPERAEFEASGRIWLRNALIEDELRQLDAACPAKAQSQRHLPSSSLIRVLGRAGALSNLLEAFLPNAFPTRVVSFSKSNAHNWAVPWHQDRVIAVAEKHDVEGFAQWSCKTDDWHCEPPLHFLENMLFVRVHLDDDIVGNGAMDIALGSHKLGRVNAEEAEAQASTFDVETCHAKRGDVLLLKMLTLHRSSASTQPSVRRVIRCDFANTALPDPLDWTKWTQAE